MSLPIPTWKIHNIFHASLCSPYKETEAHGPNFSKSPTNLIGTKEEYKVEQIVSHQGTSGCHKYLTAWKDYPSLANTWKSESNLQHASDILSTYKKAHQLSYMAMTTCPSFQNMTTLPLPLDQLTFPGFLDLPSINLPFFDNTTSPYLMSENIPGSARKLGAPSTTRIQEVASLCEVPSCTCTLQLQNPILLLQTLLHSLSLL